MSQRESLWQHVGGEPRASAWDELADVPAATAESEAMSRQSHGPGFRFVGPTICYALMQSAGPVDDHLVGRFRHGAASARAPWPSRPGVASRPADSA
jgi:DNA-3-methyladenine glycosylase I